MSWTFRAKKPLTVDRILALPSIYKKLRGDRLSSPAIRRLSLVNANRVHRMSYAQRHLAFDQPSAAEFYGPPSAHISGTPYEQ